MTEELTSAEFATAWLESAGILDFGTVISKSVIDQVTEHFGCSEIDLICLMQEDYDVSPGPQKGSLQIGSVAGSIDRQLATLSNRIAAFKALIDSPNFVELEKKKQGAIIDSLYDLYASKVVKQNMVSKIIDRGLESD